MTSSVVIVGYCASGKSTLVEALRARGVDARAVAQEHSIIDDLWNHSEPDVVIFLDVSLDAIRRRRNNPAWPEAIYRAQSKRLAAARRRADLVVDTTQSDAAETLTTALSLMESSEHHPT